MAKEIEIKFRIENLPTLTRALKQAGFKQITRSTHEMNSLYDLPGQKLRKRGEMLRLRKYGEKWLLTHKGKPTLAHRTRKDGAPEAGRHKVRVELETHLENGQQMDAVLRALGIGRDDYITQTYAPMFFAWKRRTRSPATEMTFSAIGKKSIPELR